MDEFGLPRIGSGPVGANLFTSRGSFWVQFFVSKINAWNEQLDSELRELYTFSLYYFSEYNNHIDDVIIISASVAKVLCGSF